MLRRGRGRSGCCLDRDSDARARARSDGFGGGSLRAPRMGSSKEGIVADHFFDRRAGVVRRVDRRSRATPQRTAYH